MINKRKLLINQILKVIYEYTSYFTFFILDKNQYIHIKTMDVRTFMSLGYCNNDMIKKE